jgi:hypothetical protein
MLDRPLISYSREQDFKLRYRNKKVWHNGEQVGTGDFWLDHPDRCGYEGMVFSPGQDVPGYLNLWQGWGCEPKEGDCRLWLQFVKEVICGGDQDRYSYTLKYFAHMVQFTRQLPETALVLRGEEGVGKNTFFNAIAEIVGRSNYIMLSSLSQIAGRFAGHLCDVLFVVCNEGVWGGNKEGQGILKSMITDDFQPMERKGKDIVAVSNFKRLLFSTNENWAVPRGMDDRRYVVCDVSNKRKGDYAYWKAIHNEMKNGGVEALYSRLLAVQLEGWHPRQLPLSLKEAGWEMKIQGADSVDKWWLGLLMQGWIIRTAGNYSETASVVWPDKILTTELYKNYQAYCIDNRINHIHHQVMMGKRIPSFGIKVARPRGNNNSARPLYYTIPPIVSARENFRILFSLPVNVWHDDAQDFDDDPDIPDG